MWVMKILGAHPCTNVGQVLPPFCQKYFGERNILYQSKEDDQTQRRSVHKVYDFNSQFKKLVFPQF